MRSRITISPYSTDRYSLETGARASNPGGLCEHHPEHDEACGYLTQVGLCARDYLGRDVDASLSGGEVKRIEIATLLARNAKLMIFDEPEAGIDLWSFARLTETFRSIHDRQDRTILIISHQERIIRLADEIVLIAGGQITARGSVDELYPQILTDTVTGCNMLEVNGTC